MINSNRHGATVVEFALVLPILLLFVFGGVELSRLAMLRHTANHAAYAATRKAIVPGANVANVIQKAEDHLAMIGISNASVTVNPSVITESTSIVEVEVTFPIADNSLVVPEFVSGTVTGKSAMMTERSKASMSGSLPAPPPPPPPPTPPTPPTPPAPTPPPVSPVPSPVIPVPSPPSPPPPSTPTPPSPPPPPPPMF